MLQRSRFSSIFIACALLLALTTNAAADGLVSGLAADVVDAGTTVTEQTGASSSSSDAASSTAAASAADVVATVAESVTDPERQRDRDGQCGSNAGD